MRVWDGSSDASISFSNDDGSNLATIVENDLIQASIIDRLQAISNVQLIYSNQIKHFEQNEHSVKVQLNDDSIINTKLLIGSDGVNSIIRSKGDFNVTKWDYDQVGIVATVKLSSRQMNETAWQRFLPTGPIALLPLDDQYSSLVWSIKESMASELLHLNDQDFAMRINQAFVHEHFKNQFAINAKNLTDNALDLISQSNSFCF
jgi:ubiquinone biosynthesis monooxygenase Coq6